MERAVYTVEDAIEERHWWFAGRRRLFARELRRAGIADDADTLDIGTSTGTNLRLLRELGLRHVIGLDNSEDAVRFCRDKGLGQVERGDVLAMPFADRSFDLVLATDLIEHVAEDGRALGEIQRVLRPGGQALLTVPTFAALWGLQDRVAQHKRRYRLTPLRRAVQEAGQRPLRAFLFQLSPIPADLPGAPLINTPLINHLLGAIFLCDIATAPWLRPPFGASILMLAEKARRRPARR
jgi:SAM-dependent methyltransferase